MDNNNLRNPSVPYTANTPAQGNGQSPTPLFAGVSRPAPPQTPASAVRPLETTPLAPPGLTPLPSATPPTPTALPATPVVEKPKPPRDTKKILTRAGIAVFAILLTGAGLLLYSVLTNKNNKAVLSSTIENTNIPLSEFAQSGSLALLGAQSLSINGQLRANESFILAPQAEPVASRSERGQLYYDSNRNVLAYYNGLQYVQLTANNNAVVQTFQGQSGNVSLVSGNGVIITGTTIANSGVTSIGGQAGDITVGNGLTMNGTTLQATGVQSLTSATPGLTVTDDGNGNLTIANTGAGSGTVTSSGGTNGHIPMFTSAQNVEDSIITQSGLTVTITGDLSIITGGISLSNALTVSNGGTGTTSLAANGVIVGNGTSALTSVTAAGAGLCLLSTAGAPTFTACPSASGVTSLNGLTGGLSIANASAAGSTITLDNASTSTKGIAQFNSTNFSASAGVINTIQDINTTAAPTFGRLTVTSSQATNPMLLVNNTNAGASGNLIDAQLNGSSKFAVAPNGDVTATGTINGQTISSAANFTGTLEVSSTLTAGGAINANGGSITSSGALNITSSGTLAVGSSGQTLSLQGGSSSSFVVTNGGNTTTLNFQAPSATVTYRLPTATAGSYDLCTTAGNCTSLGGTVTTPGGATNRVAKFTASGTIDNSSITDTGTTVTTTANLVVQGGATTIGVANSTTGTLTLAYGGANFSGAITQGTLSANRSYVLPDADGTVCLSSGNCLGGGGGGANTALSNLTSVAINTSLLPGTTTIDLGSTSSPFRNLFLAGSSLSPGTNNFTITGTATAARTITLPDATGTVCLQSSAACGFATGSGVAILQGGNTLGAAADIGTNDGNVLNLRTNGSTQVSIATNGNATFNADVAVNGGDITSSGALNITPGGTLTVGATGQALTLQGNASTKITATGGGFTTTVGFTGTPAGAVTYNFDRAATAGAYTVCTTAANCSAVGGGVTASSAGTTGTLPVFTGAQTIADSLLSQSGSVVTAAGDLNLTTGHVYKINGTQIASNDLSNDANLAKLSASQTFTGNTNSFKNGTNSTNAFNVQNALGNRVLTVDTSSGQLVLGTSSSLDGKLVFATAAGANTVTISSGALTGSHTLTLPDADGVICTDTGNCLGAGATLQTAYNFSVGGTTPKIKVNSSLLGVDIQDADTTIAANLFNIRASNGSGLGAVMFGVSSTGAVTLQNSANSATALRLLTQGGTSVLTGDTQNGRIILGQGGTLDGKLAFSSASNSNTGTLQIAALGQNTVYTLPDPASGTATICLSSGNCSGGANTSLSNLSSVAINTALLPGAAGTINLGSGTLPFADMYLAGTSGTPGTNNFKITGASTSGTRTITLPDASGTVCLQSSSSCGFVVGSGTAFLQGGNSFSATATLGTNDSNQLDVRTNSTTRLTFGAAGGLTVASGNTIDIDSNTLQGTAAVIDFTNFDVSSAGVITLAGAQTKDITTANAAASTALTLKPGDTTGASGTGAAITIAGGDSTSNSCASTCTGGNVVIQGGSVPGTSGTHVGGSVNIDGATANNTNGSVNIAANSALVNVGSTTVAGTVRLQNATGGTIKISDNGNTGSVQIGNTTGAVAQTIAIGNNATGSSTSTVTVGSLIGSSTTTIQGGTGNVILTTNQSTASVVVKSQTNGTAAFKVTNSTDVPLLVVDTTNNLTYIGNPTGDTTGTQLVLDAKTDYTNGANSSSEPTGVIGGMYYNSALSQFRCYELDHWRDCLESVRTTYHVSRDFMGTQTDNEFGTDNSGGGSVSNQAGEIHHPGIVRENVSTLNQWIYAGAQNNGSNMIRLGNGDYWRLESEARITTLSTSAQRFTYRSGFIDNIREATGNIIQNGCYIRYTDVNNSGKWQGVCRAGGTESTCDAGTTVVAGTWYRTIVIVRPDNTAMFTVYPAGSTTSTSCSTPISTNVPTSATDSWGNTMSKEVGSSAVSVDMDFIDVSAEFGSTR